MEEIRRQYSEEFKKDAVGHSLTSEKTVAFPYSPSDMAVGPVYNFNIYHLVEAENLSETSEVEFVEVGV